MLSAAYPELPPPPTAPRGSAVFSFRPATVTFATERRGSRNARRPQGTAALTVGIPAKSSIVFRAGSASVR